MKKILAETGENALALLVTSEKIEFNDYVQPACIDTSGKPFNITEKSVGEVSESLGSVEGEFWA